MYLLDTNIVSELRRTRPHRAVIDWLSDIPDDRLFISAVTLGELQAAVEITRRQDQTKAEEIEAWVDEIAATGAVLPADGPIFRHWARLMQRRSADLIEDALIAATAVVHNLTVATRNERDFEKLGVAVVNPCRLEK